MLIQTVIYANFTMQNKYTQNNYKNKSGILNTGQAANKRDEKMREI